MSQIFSLLKIQVFCDVTLSKWSQTFRRIAVPAKRRLLHTQQHSVINSATLLTA